jgi:predicted membrane protein
MKLDFFQISFLAFATFFTVYLAFCIYRMLKAPQVQREGKALVNDNTHATRENSALLRELIAVNRQILEKLDEAKP